MHKQCLATAVTFAISFSTLGSPVPQEELEECQRIENSAKQVMKTRQQGVPMASVLEMAEAAGKQNEYVGEVFKTLIREAYAIPQYSSESLQQKAIRDFHSNFYKACIVTVEKRANAKG
ncbi:hypothetical protein [Pseudomonas fluorescens]|uniref:hypothetical protein n=1 Tax=Pseudomonas fluorescens TaxID=294 RepID=UPI001A9FB948|nr:hypothetical protein [Pseudomonas fluorescens]QTD31148.1 hypothetical protein JZM58_17810 [Pseudomonas fluorescens]